MLLQILEDGNLTDAKGRVIDFSNTIIIMTSNIGAEKLQKEAVLGFSASDRQDFDNLDALHEANKGKVHDELKKLMRPELLNRIDKVIVFHALGKKDVGKILDLQLQELNDRLVKQGIAIDASAKAKDWLLQKGYDSHYGVRPMRRLIQDEIEDVLAGGLLEDTYKKGTIVKIGVKGGALTFSAVK